MANVTTALANTAGFVPQIWAQRALDYLRTQFVMTRLIAKDTDYDAFRVGSTLTIPYPGAFTASDKAADTPLAVQVPSGGASVSVTLNKHKAVDFIVEDVARAQANPNLIDRYAQPAIDAIAGAVEDDLFALYSSMTGGTIGTSGTDLTDAIVRTAEKTLNDQKAPIQNRSLVVSTKDHAALQGVSGLQNFYAWQTPEAIRDGKVTRLYGFDVYWSQRVKVVAGAPNSTKNLAIHKDAMILASRPFVDDMPANAGAEQAVVVDPETGLAIRVVMQYDIANRGVRVGYDALYGVAALRPTLGVVAQA